MNLIQSVELMSTSGRVVPSWMGYIQDGEIREFKIPYEDEEEPYLIICGLVIKGGKEEKRI